jgi:hypothetical protein
LAASHVTFDFFSVVTLTSTGANGLWGTQDAAGPWTCLEANPYGNSSGSLTFTANSGTSWPGTAAGQINTSGTAQILEMVYNGSGATATMTMYKNGNLIATATGLPVSPDMTGFVATGGQGYDCPPWVSAGSPGSGYTSYSYSGFHGAEGDMIWYNTVLSRGSDGFSGDAGNVGYYLQQKYGISGSYIGTVPEPGTLALLAAGLAALLCYAWRKRR